MDDRANNRARNGTDNFWSWLVYRPPSSSSGSVTNNNALRSSRQYETHLMSSPGGGASCPSSSLNKTPLKMLTNTLQRWQLGLPLTYLRRPSQEEWPKGQFPCLLYRACLHERQHLQPRRRREGVELHGKPCSCEMVDSVWELSRSMRWKRKHEAMPFSTQLRARVHAANRLDDAEVNWREASGLCTGVTLALHPPCRATIW